MCLDVKEQLESMRKLHPEFKWKINHNKVVILCTFRYLSKIYKKVFNPSVLGLETAKEQANKWMTEQQYKVDNRIDLDDVSRKVFNGIDDFEIPPTEGICVYEKDGKEYILVHISINNKTLRKNLSIHALGKKVAYETALGIREKFYQENKHEISIAKENKSKKLSGKRMNINGVLIDKNTPIENIFYYDLTSPSHISLKNDIYHSNSIVHHKHSKIDNIVKGYHFFNVASISYAMHRVVYELHFGEIPNNMFIDHINGNPSDNRIENLRIVTIAENNRNAKLSKLNTSGVNSVRFMEVGKHKYAIAYWRDINGKPKQKLFSCLRMSDGAAFQKAVEYRKLMIDELNAQGAGYHENHGKKREFN